MTRMNVHLYFGCLRKKTGLSVIVCCLLLWHTALLDIQREFWRFAQILNVEQLTDLSKRSSFPFEITTIQMVGSIERMSHLPAIHSSKIASLFQYSLFKYLFTYSHRRIQYRSILMVLTNLPIRKRLLCNSNTNSSCIYTILSIFFCFFTGFISHLAYAYTIRTGSFRSSNHILYTAHRVLVHYQQTSQYALYSCIEWHVVVASICYAI